MREVFGDAGYWIAVADIDDALHQAAIGLSRTLKGVLVVTHELVLVELLDHFSGYGPVYRAKALQVVERILNGPDTFVAELSGYRFEQALRRYGRYADKEWGLTDCYSFTLMEERGISEALAYDHHFMQAGFRPLLRDS